MFDLLPPDSKVPVLGHRQTWSGRRKLDKSCSLISRLTIMIRDENGRVHGLTLDMSNRIFSIRKWENSHSYKKKFLLYMPNGGPWTRPFSLDWVACKTCKQERKGNNFHIGNIQVGILESLRKRSSHLRDNAALRQLNQAHSSTIILFIFHKQIHDSLMGLFQLSTNNDTKLVPFERPTRHRKIEKRRTTKI